jgi:hypothetical protein
MKQRTEVEAAFGSLLDLGFAVAAHPLLIKGVIHARDSLR